MIWLRSSRLLGLLGEHRVDVVIVTLTAPPEGFVCERLVEQRVEILVPADHPWWGRPSLQASELSGERFIFREEGSMTRHLFERGMAARGLESQGGRQSGSSTEPQAGHSIVAQLR